MGELKRQIVQQAKYEQNGEQINFRDVINNQTFTNSGVSYRKNQNLYKVNYSDFPKNQDINCWTEGKKLISDQNITEISKSSFITDLSREI